jgi:excisionase family DNA binding protein
VSSPYLTSQEAADYLKLPSVNALYKLMARSDIPRCRRGGDWLFDVRELDAWLRGTTAIDLLRERTAKKRPGRPRLVEP